MRARLILALVAGLLFCTLTTLELPEFLKLTDDTSNDFMLDDVESTVPVAIEGVAPRSDDPVSLAVRVIHKAFVAHPAPALSSTSGREILRSFCVLRT